MLDKILKNSQDSYFAEPLSFQEYLKDLENYPKKHLRTGAMYLKDTFDHFGKNKNGRFSLFSFENDENKKVYGNQHIQERIYNSLNNFIKEGYNNKLVLLVGPNGSAKTSLIHKIMRACETYSTKDEGSLYTFSWIFPTSTSGNLKNSIGLNSGNVSSSESFAHLKDDAIGSILLSELKDHPLLLIPLKPRREYLHTLLKDDPDFFNLIKKTYLFNGDVSKQNRDIFDALLKQYNGDFNEVFKHIRIERFSINKRYSKGAVTIEPQMHVDAQMRQITMDQKIQNLPPAIQALNLTTSSGELIYANRGMLEYSDFLKRPVDTFKYLLMTVENKNINIKGILTELDIIFFGTSNEMQYEAFKNSPDFKSFKARFKTIHVPYLLSFKDEKHIYKDHVEKMGDNFFEPHTLEAFATWSVMTRLHQPKEDSTFDNDMNKLLSKLNALDKAILYSGHIERLSDKFNSEELKLLQNNITNLKKEAIKEIPTNQGVLNYYEGRYGLSPREGKEILFDLCNQKKKISFVDILDYVRELSKERIYGDQNTSLIINTIEKDQSDHSSFKNNEERVNLIEEYYWKVFDEELRDSLGLVDSMAYDSHIEKYIVNINAYMKKEQLFNKTTQKYEDVNLQFIENFEEQIGVRTRDASSFRNDVLGKVGAYALDNPNTKINYKILFKDSIYKKLKNNFIESQRDALKEISTELIYRKNDRETDLSEDKKNLLDNLLVNLEKKYGYSKDTALQLIEMKYKY